MIGIDWGTTHFRAYRLSAQGSIRERRNSTRGIMAIADSRFAESLREEIGPWLAAGEDKVLMSGMVGSRQGWKEIGYVSCPASVQDLAAKSITVAFDWANVRIVPGLTATDQNGIAEFMRGEETQVAGLLPGLTAEALVCLPGTHAKWVVLRDHKVYSFSTFMTGEVFGALKAHTILGRMIRDAPVDIPTFDAGLKRANEAGGLLHHVFGVRAETLAGRLTEELASSYLSGILIGHEVHAALSQYRAPIVHVVGAPELTTLYARAVALSGRQAEIHDADAAAAGLFSIGSQIHWS